MSEDVTKSDEVEPVCKRTRRTGVVASIGDPNLKDRTKVAPLFLTLKEKQEKLYKKEIQKLVQSTKSRLNDWKSVIGVEKDVSKVCPVFQKVSVASAAAPKIDYGLTTQQSLLNSPALIDPLVGCPIVPVAPGLVNTPNVDLVDRPSSSSVIDSESVDSLWHSSCTWDESGVVELGSPETQPIPHLSPLFPTVEKNLQAACLSTLSSLLAGIETVDQVPFIGFSSTRDWNSARLDSKKPHGIFKCLAKWKDEDTAVRRNKVAPVLLITGPTGSGKTSLVYAAANELNIQVLEVGPPDFSWQSNGSRQISQAVKEALHSRQVKQGGTELASQIVLIDDVDVLVREDKSVVHALAQITQDSKRPLVLTGNVDSEQLLSQLYIDEVFKIEVPDLARQSFLVHAYNEVFAGKISCPTKPTPDQCFRTAVYCGNDLRKIALNFSTAASVTKFSVLPKSVFTSDDFDRYLTLPLSQYKVSGIERAIMEDDTFPVQLCTTSSNCVDLLDVAHNHVLKCEDDIFRLNTAFSDLVVASCVGASAPSTAAHIALQSLRVRCPSEHPYALTKSTQQLVDTAQLGTSSKPRFTSIAQARSMIEPFLSTLYITSAGSRDLTLGVTLNALSRMARISPASEFSSRRVHCFLDKCGKPAETERVRALIFRN